jgi:HAD superfamily hydrolase (TIGR01509 family)
MATLFFDLGNVLLYFSFPRMFEQMSNLLGIPPHVLHNEILNKGLGLEFEKGKIDKHSFHKQLCKLANKNVPLDALANAVSDIFTPNWPMATLLRELKNKGHRLLLLSNTNEIHFSFAKRHYPEMFHSFDDFVLSYEVGYAKPEPEIYRTALSKTQSPPSQCFYTDDIPDFIEAATRANIPSMLFTGIDPLIGELRSRGYL